MDDVLTRARLVTLAAAMMAFSATVIAAQDNGLALTIATTSEIQLRYARSADLSENLDGELWASITPVSSKIGLKANWLPFPFLVLSAEATAGTGWNIPIADGLKINEPTAAPGARNLVPADFGGVVWSVEAGGTFQFDLAALIPGDWNHVVFLTYHGAQYRAFTGAGAEESWLFEADAGENRNGWSYSGNAFIGYQMPLWLNVVGFLAEMSVDIDSVAGREAWGGHVPRWTLGALCNINLGQRLAMTLLAQMQTELRFTEETKDYAFYQDRVIATETPSWAWYRAAMILSYRF